MRKCQRDQKALRRPLPKKNKIKIKIAHPPRPSPVTRARGVSHRSPRFSRSNGSLHIMQKGIRWVSQPFSITLRQRCNGARCPAAPPPLRAHTRGCVWASVWAWVGVGTSACAPHDAQVRARQPASARGREGVGARAACMVARRRRDERAAGVRRRRRVRGGARAGRHGLRQRHRVRGRVVAV